MTTFNFSAKQIFLFGMEHKILRFSEIMSLLTDADLFGDPDVIEVIAPFLLMPGGGSAHHCTPESSPAPKETKGGEEEKKTE